MHQFYLAAAIGAALQAGDITSEQAAGLMRALGIFASLPDLADMDRRGILSVGLDGVAEVNEAGGTWGAHMHAMASLGLDPAFFRPEDLEAPVARIVAGALDTSPLSIADMAAAAETLA